MKNIKAIIFDMDGIIIDSEPLWEETEKIFIENKGIPYNPDYRDKILGLNQFDSAKLLKKTFKLEEKIDNIIDERTKILLNLFDRKLELIPTVRDLIHSFHSENYTLAIASSSSMKIINFAINKFSLRKYFTAIISAENVKLGKPKPDIYLETAKKIGINPNNCIAIEDSVNGVTSAVSAGMHCIAVPDKRISIEKYSSCDLIVESVSEINVDLINKINS